MSQLLALWYLRQNSTSPDSGHAAMEQLLDISSPSFLSVHIFIHTHPAQQGGSFGPSTFLGGVKILLHLGQKN